MKILFLHQNFPGQFKLLAEAISKRPGVQVLGLGDEARLKERGLKFSYSVLGYKARQPEESSAHHYLQGFEQDIRRGQDVVRAVQRLKDQGFYPDIVIGHPGWGELLFIKDVFPQTRLVSFFEYFYRSHGGDVGFDPEFPVGSDLVFKLRMKNSTQLHALNDCDAGVSPTAWQKSTYPSRFQPLIHQIHEGIDTESLQPNPNARFVLPDGRVLTRNEQVITFVSRNLEPYRGFHRFMRALPAIQRHLPKVQVVIVGGDSVSYGQPPAPPFSSWREKMRNELDGRLNMEHIHFVGKIPYPAYVSLLQTSSLHLYLTYPFVLSWSFLEAMACGAPVLASDTPPVAEVIKQGENGYLFDFFDEKSLASSAVAILQGGVRNLTREARYFVRSEYSFQHRGLPDYEKLFKEILE